MVETITGEGVRIRGMVDTVPSKYLLGACLAGLVYLIVMLIVGGAGPPSHVEWEEYSFLCNGSFDYRFKDGCVGNDMSLPGTQQEIQIPPKEEDETLTKTNFQFSMIAWPYNAKYTGMSDSLSSNLKVKTTLYGSHDVDLKETTLIFDRESTENLICPRNRPDCYGFYLFVERTIDYPYYKVEVEFLDSPGKKYIENVMWETTTQSIAFNDLQLGFRYTYFAITVILIIIWIIPLRNLSPSQWPFEQRSVFLLLIGLVFFNNPFFALHLTANSWFWTYLDALFQILFVCLLFFYWFASLGRIRYAYVGTPPNRIWIFYVKVVLVAAYGVSANIVSYWMDVKFNRSSEFEGFGGIITFYYFSSLFCAACIVWVMIGGMMHLPPASVAHPHRNVSYVYVAVLGIAVTTSMLVGTFAGMVGPYNQTSVSFMYYFGMFNVYVYLLAFGFFPSVSDLGRGYEVDVEGMKLEDQHLIQHNINANVEDPNDNLSGESAARALAGGF